MLCSTPCILRVVFKCAVRAKRHCCRLKPLL
uniref:Uncharacterized protein n=1 Tax=Anguilla anguilla TaxID=7936 RepID=A0A0E9P5T3_ANGAN